MKILIARDVLCSSLWDMGKILQENKQRENDNQASVLEILRMGRDSLFNCDIRKGHDRPKFLQTQRVLKPMLDELILSFDK